MNSQAKSAITSFIIILSTAFVLFRLGQFVIAANLTQKISNIKQPFSNKSLPVGSGHFVTDTGVVQFDYPKDWQISLSTELEEFNQYGQVNKVWILSDTNGRNQVNVIELDKQNTILGDDRISCEYFPVGCSQITVGDTSHLQLRLPTPEGFSTFIFVKTNQYVYILHFTENTTDQLYQEITTSLQVQ